MIKVDIFIGCSWSKSIWRALSTVSLIIIFLFYVLDYLSKFRSVVYSATSCTCRWCKEDESVNRDSESSTPNFLPWLFIEYHHIFFCFHQLKLIPADYSNIGLLFIMINYSIYMPNVYAGGYRVNRHGIALAF